MRTSAGDPRRTRRCDHIGRPLGNAPDALAFRRRLVWKRVVSSAPIPSTPGAVAAAVPAPEMRRRNWLAVFAGLSVGGALTVRWWHRGHYYNGFEVLGAAQ